MSFGYVKSHSNTVANGDCKRILTLIMNPMSTDTKSLTN